MADRYAGPVPYNHEPEIIGDPPLSDGPPKYNLSMAALVVILVAILIAVGGYIFGNQHAWRAAHKQARAASSRSAADQNSAYNQGRQNVLNSIDATDKDPRSFFNNATANLTVDEFERGFGPTVGWLTQDGLVVDAYGRFFYDASSSARVSATRHGAFSIRVTRMDPFGGTIALPKPVDLLKIVEANQTDRFNVISEVWPGSSYPVWNPYSDETASVLAAAGKSLLAGPLRATPAPGFKLQDYIDHQAAELALSKPGTTGYLSTEDVIAARDYAGAPLDYVGIYARLSTRSYGKDGPTGATAKVKVLATGQVQICLKPGQKPRVEDFAQTIGPGEEPATIVVSKSC